MAPEVFRHELYNHKVDQYSFAMIAYQVGSPGAAFPGGRGHRPEPLGDEHVWGQAGNLFFGRAAPCIHKRTEAHAGVHTARPQPPQPKNQPPGAQLFEGAAPFWLMDPVEAAKIASQHGVRPKWGESHGIKRRIPGAVKDLVERCWAADYDSRPEFTEVIAALEAVLRELPRDAPAAEGGCCSVM
jgi:hypothetical protein